MKRSWLCRPSNLWPDHTLMLAKVSTISVDFIQDLGKLYFCRKQVVLHILCRNCWTKNRSSFRQIRCLRFGSRDSRISINEYQSKQRCSSAGSADTTSQPISCREGYGKRDHGRFFACRISNFLRPLFLFWCSDSNFVLMHKLCINVILNSLQKFILLLKNNGVWKQQTHHSSV